jgi:hypothetical protein
MWLSAFQRGPLTTPVEDQRECAHRSTNRRREPLLLFEAEGPHTPSRCAASSIHEGHHPAMQKSRAVAFRCTLMHRTAQRAARLSRAQEPAPLPILRGSISKVPLVDAQRTHRQSGATSALPSLCALPSLLSAKTESGREPSSAGRQHVLMMKPAQYRIGTHDVVLSAAARPSRQARGNDQRIVPQVRGRPPAPLGYTACAFVARCRAMTGER